MSNGDMVQTKRGLMPRDQLRYEDRTAEDALSVTTHRDWFALDDGELVRCDAWVDMKTGVEAASTHGQLQ